MAPDFDQMAGGKAWLSIVHFAVFISKEIAAEIVYEDEEIVSFQGC